MMLDLGTVGSPEEAAEKMTEAFLRFRRAGGVFSWGEWAQMAPETRAAAEAAGLEYERELSRIRAEEFGEVEAEASKIQSIDELLADVGSRGALA